LHHRTDNIRTTEANLALRNAEPGNAIEWAIRVYSRKHVWIGGRGRRREPKIRLSRGEDIGRSSGIPMPRTSSSPDGLRVGG
jgi:hypothetical protein